MKKKFNKILEIIKRCDNICVFFILFSVLGIYLYTKKMVLGDEFWLFSFVYKFSNGYKLYGDLNILTTPLFHFLGKIILQVLGDSYSSFRIYGALIFSTLFTMIYMLLKKMKVKKINAFTYIMCLYFVFYIKSFFLIGASYNYLALIFIIAGIMLEINNKKNSVNKVLKGVILFFIFITKQNVVALYVLALIIIYLMKIKRSEISIKDVMKSTIIICISFVIPLIFLIVYLIINNTLGDFISYCFLGTVEFGSKNLFFRLTAIPIIVVYIVGIIISSIIIRKKDINEEVRNINFIILPIEIIMVLWAFPILDEYHMLVGTMVSIIILIYNIHNLFILEMKNKKVIQRNMKIIIFVIFLFSVLCSGERLYMYINSDEKNYDIKPYIGVIIDKSLKNKINTICNYVEENEKLNIDTKIISSDANLYCNVLHKNNRNMDMPLVGNLGKGGEEGLISEVRNLKEKTQILIPKTKLSWQESEKLRNVIMNELKQIGEIENFYIYEK